MAQTTFSSAKQSIMSRMSCSGKVGASVKLDKIPNNSVEESIFNLNDEIILPSLEELRESAFDREFTSNGRKFHGYGIVVDLVDGSAKALYFSQLKKTVISYTEEEGEFIMGLPVTFDTELSRIVRSCGTAEEICEKIQNRHIKVTKIEEVTTARYNNGTIIGLRKVNLPHFDFVEDTSR